MIDTAVVASIVWSTVLAGTGGVITDASGNQWTISPKAVVLQNGLLAGFTEAVAEIAYVNGIVWCVNTYGKWYSWNGVEWIAGANPLLGEVDMKADPIVTMNPLVVKGSTEIDFSGTITGLAAGDAVRVVVDAIVGASGEASAQASTSTAPPPPPPPPSGVIWDSTTTTLQLNVDKTIATNGSGLKSAVRAAVAVKATDLIVYWVMKALKGGQNFAVGIANGSFPMAGDFLGQEGNAFGFYSFDPAIPLTGWLNNREVEMPITKVTVGTDIDGAEFRCVLNAQKKLFFWQTPEMVTVFGQNAWNDNPNADPITGVGGQDISVLGGGPWWPIVGTAENGESAQLITTGRTDVPIGATLLGAA